MDDCVDPIPFASLPPNDRSSSPPRAELGARTLRDAFTKTFIAVEEVGHGVRSDDDEGTSMHSEQMISKKLLGCAYLKSRDLLT